MSLKLEYIKQQNDTIQQELDALMSETDLAKKQEKNQELLQKATSLKGQINQALEALKSKSDVTSQRESELMQSELERVDAVFELLEKNKTELGNLQKNIFEKTGDWIKGDEAESHHTLKQVARGTAVVGAGVGVFMFLKKGWNWLWGDKKESQTSDEQQQNEKKEEQKGFWQRWYGKVLKRGGGLLGGTWIGRGLLTGKWDFFGRNPFKNSKEQSSGSETIPGFGLDSTVKDYEKLTPEEQRLFHSSATAINAYQANIFADGSGETELVEDIMGDSSFDHHKPGLIPFMLNNRYATLQDMLSETAFYYEIVGVESGIARDKLKNRGLEELKDFLLVPLAKGVDIATFNLLKSAKTVNEFVDTLKAAPESEQVLRTVFRKSITVMSYYQSRKGVLESYLASQVLEKADPDFGSLSAEEKAEVIADKLEDQSRYDQHIKSEIEHFMKLNLKTATQYLEQKGLLNAEVSPQVQEALAKVEERKRELLEIEDEDDESLVETIKSELSEGKLTPSAQKKLETLCASFEQEVLTYGKQAWYIKYFPLMNMFGLDEQMLYQIQQTGDYDRIAQIYQQQIQSVLKKSQEGKLEKSDLDHLQATINDYYKFQKSLTASQVNIDQAIDQQGNLVLRWLHTVKIGGQNICSGVQMVIDSKKGNGREGAGLIVGGVLSIDALTFGLAGKKTLGFSPFWVLNKKVTFPLAKGTLKLTGKAVSRVTGNMIRANVPALMPNRMYTPDTLKIAVGRGEVSLSRAARIAKSKGIQMGAIGAGNGVLVETPHQVVQYLFGVNESEGKRVAKVLETFGENPKVYTQIFPEYYQKAEAAWRKPEEWLKLNRANMKFRLDMATLDRLEAMMLRVENLQDGVEKQVLKSMMKSVKALDRAEELMIMGVGDDMIRFLESGKGISPQKYGNYLAKYAGKIDANELRAFEKFVIDAKNTGKIGSNESLFLRKSLKNFAQIKNSGFDPKTIDALKLNQGKREKASEVVKSTTQKMIAKLDTMASQSRFKPFWSSIRSQSASLKQYLQTVTPDALKAMRNFSVFGKESAFAKLSGEGIQELVKLKNLLKTADQAGDLSKALKTAKTLDKVKEVLQQQGIVASHIDDAVLLKLANTSQLQKIKDIIDYGAEFTAVKGVQKMLKNPAFKQVGRVVGKAMIGLDAIFVGYQFVNQYEEAQNIKKINLERGERKEDQAYFELGTGGLGALAGACMFIPGVGWIAGGVLAASIGVMEVGKQYFEDIEKFKQNQTDFLAKGIAATKQELVSVDSRDQGLSRSWIDQLAVLDQNWLFFTPAGLLGQVGQNSLNQKQAGAPKTKAEALKGLIRMEEAQKNPLAAMDMNAPEVIANPELMEAVRLAKQEVESLVDKRFAYLKSTYLDQHKPLIEKSKFGKTQALEELEKIMENSSIAALMQADTSISSKMNPDQYRAFRLEKLTEGNEENFKKMEKLFIEHQISCFEYYAQLPYYRHMLLQYGDEKSQKLMEACDFFEKYVSRKMLGKSIEKRPMIKIQPEKIDYTPLHTFLSHFALMPRVFEESETQQADLEITDKMILEKYGVSGVLGQDILFEWAKLLNYPGNNDLAQLKSFFTEQKKEVHGVYFDGKDRVINENNASDDEFAKDGELDDLQAIERMRNYIYDNTHGAMHQGKMFTESDEINQELGKKILKIVDTHLKLRKGRGSLAKGMIDYLHKHHIEGKYLQLPTELLIKARRAGYADLGSYVYTYHQGKILAKNANGIVQLPF